MCSSDLIYKGLDILINTPLANYISAESERDDSYWVVYGDHGLAQYALANNAKILNGVHIYPQFQIWKILDPQGEYKDVYNRYAHIIVSEYTEGEELTKLIVNDALEININPCDERLKKLGVKYILSNIVLSNTTCLKQEKAYNNVMIYTIQE